MILTDRFTKPRHTKAIPNPKWDELFIQLGRLLSLHEYSERSPVKKLLTDV
ncbi:MAG: hypothetical protein RMY36_003765 [Nostoc sp. SerVER01]|nr:hypothetical protein [Nostoc sp. SerVER01]MDZ8023969.1 hypothetical protein [Nostoc sp. DedQUE11]MDZ8074263.1 hypothetical protein [Nostoc sp. DedQUE01]MDZ8081549.1 hypothetical protein [Nostoc sp. DcaGUA01]MDZ8241827.1 hypothetical protein [Nostoc sp. ChiQUE01a]